MFFDVYLVDNVSYFQWSESRHHKEQKKQHKHEHCIINIHLDIYTLAKNNTPNARNLLKMHACMSRL